MTPQPDTRRIAEFDFALIRNAVRLSEARTDASAAVDRVEGLLRSCDAALEAVGGRAEQAEAALHRLCGMFPENRLIHEVAEKALSEGDNQ